MRVLVFTSTCNRGGHTRIVETLLPAFQRAGIEMEILGQRYNEIGDEIHYPPDIPFHQVRPINKLPLHPHQFPFLAQNAQVFVDHALEMEADFDLIWCPAPFWSLGYARTYAFTKPVVVDVADFAFDYIDMGEYLTNFFKISALQLAQRVTHTIFSSDFQRKHGENYYGYAHTSTIRYSLDFSPPAEQQRPLENFPDRYLLAFHPMGHKGLQTMLHAYAQVLAVQPDAPKLLLAGLDTDKLRDPHSKDPEVHQTWLTIHNLGLNQKILVAGFIEESGIADLYRRAVAVLTATTSEGDLSGTMLESIRYQRPLIYSNLPLFQERLTDGVHGLAFPIRDDRGMARQILNVMDNPAAACQRAEKAYQDFSQRSADDVAQEFIQIFERYVGTEE